MITQQEYLSRRKALAAKLPCGSIAIIPAAKELLRNGDAHYRFRQDSNFYYLCGFNEPEALLLIEGESAQTYLFNRPKNELLEQWTGKRLGQDDAKQALLIDAAYSIDDLDDGLINILRDKSSVFLLLGQNTVLEQNIIGLIKALKNESRKGLPSPGTLVDLEPILSEMRLFKSEAEIALMRQAAKISIEAHKRAMRTCKDSMHEHQLEAELIYELNRQGCRNVAYDSIVAGGANACILHYSANNQPIDDNDLVLIDAGGEFENYAADITRTYPKNGRFNAEQRAIYSLVLKAQQAGIGSIRPGLIWSQVQQTMVQILTAGLCELGILQGDVDALIKSEAYKSFYMHSSGHWLGLDVHDAGQYKINGQWRPLQAGMVLTVEPGIYIKAGLKGVDPRWWNIGVRIEDDILVTPDGHDNLTANLPVEINDIEALMRA